MKVLSDELALIQKNSDDTIEAYEQQYHLETQRDSLQLRLDALAELEHVQFDHIKKLLTTFQMLDHHDVRLRTFIRNYVHSIKVCREEVAFLLDFGFGCFDAVV